MRLYTLTPNQRVTEGIEVTHNVFRLGDPDGIETLVAMLDWNGESPVKGAVPAGPNRMRQSGKDTPVPGSRSGAVGLLIQCQSAYGERWDVVTSTKVMPQPLFSGYCTQRGPEFFFILEPETSFRFKRIFTGNRTGEAKEIHYTVCVDINGNLTVSEPRPYGVITGKVGQRIFVDNEITQPSEPFVL